MGGGRREARALAIQNALKWCLWLGGLGLGAVGHVSVSMAASPPSLSLSTSAISLVGPFILSA